MTSPVPNPDRKFSVLLPEDAERLLAMYQMNYFLLGKLYESEEDARILTSLKALASGQQEVMNIWKDPLAQPGLI